MKDRTRLNFTESQKSQKNSIPYHTMDEETVFKELNSSGNGLSSTDASERLSQYGQNILPKGKRESALVLLWRQINNPLIWVLIASGVVAMLIDWHGDGIKNGIVILAVVAINSLIGFIQESRAGKAIDALSQMVPQNVSVLRDNRQITIPAAELVPGDVIFLASGDRVPADVRLLSSKSLQIDEAMLTGESVPVAKNIHSVAADSDLGDRSCMAFGGTLVTYGTGSGLVAGTGLDTELGKISALLQEASSLETPLTKALTQISKYITIGIIGVTVIMLSIGIIRTILQTEATVIEAIQDTLIFAIALAVGAIPEGLPAIVTIALAIGVQRMAKRRAIVRQLPAVETLGSTTVICSDKTGTLTRNEMTVRALWTPKGTYEISGVGYEPRGELLQGGQKKAADEDVQILIQAAALCSDASLMEVDKRWTISGDPTEGALVVAAEKLGYSIEKLRKEHPRIDVIPFESENQWMATLHTSSSEEGNRILVKGAPEAIVRRCNNIELETIHRQVECLASQGMRVLAVALRQVSASTKEISPNELDSNLYLVGLLAMIDPPREEAIQAIGVCHNAGITVKMITGDHRLTASAIGKELGILTESGAMTGSELAQLSEQELNDAASQVNIFARVAPEHKLRLVRALQTCNEVVAMTGDGVNDAPALKQANIGVAMGITGTAASKQAADIVLADDNFASIGAAVEEGRRVYDNLVKALAFVLPTNLGLAQILLCSVAFFPFDIETGELLLALSPIQLLWINLVASVSLTIPLAFEVQEPDTMQRPPRHPDEPILGSFLIIRTFVVAFLMTLAAVGVFLWEYYAELAKGVRPVLAIAEAQTITVTTIIIFQCFYLANCRSLRYSFFAVGAFTNRMFYVGVALILVLQAAFIYTPGANTLFESVPLSLESWLKAVLVGAIVLPVLVFEKKVIRPLR